MINHRISIPLLFAILLFGLLSGCAQAPKAPPKPALNPVQAQQLVKAEAFEVSKDFAAAAVIYEQLAATSPSPHRDEWLVHAAQARLQGGDINGAATVVGRIQRQRLSAWSQLQERLIEAEIHLARNRGGLALRVLETPPRSNAPIDLRIRFLRDRSQALRLSGDLLGSARTLSELDLLVVKRVDRLQNQQQLLRTLTSLPNNTLEGQRGVTKGVFGGWIELAHIVKGYRSSPETAGSRLAQWRQGNPNHPALPDLVKHYLAVGGELNTLGRIAVLLPAGGRFAAATKAVKDGLLAAYYAAPPKQRPELKFYDSTNPSHIRRLLRKAVAEGAGAAIGPLQKPAVQQLAKTGGVKIPVLTLNRVSLNTAPPSNLFQFGLAPEDEAEQAADKAWVDGAKTALALVPQGNWGKRLLRSFRHRLESLGGKLIGYRTYNPEQSDFSGAIRSLMKKGRGQALFLAANWTKARQLWPQLQKHIPTDLPVYTTSHIYTGRFTPPQDLDLVGLRFPDIPWILAPEGRGPLTPEETSYQGSLARLFALGMDSYRLLANLQQLRDIRSTHLAGASGDLYLDRLNQVHRRLIWARMTKRGPQILGFTPDPDSARRTTAKSPAAAPHGQTR